MKNDFWSNKLKDRVLYNLLLLLLLLSHFSRV